MQLLDKPNLEAIPVLVLGNKKDLAGALDERQLIERMSDFFRHQFLALEKRFDKDLIRIKQGIYRG